MGRDSVVVGVVAGALVALAVVVPVVAQNASRLVFVGTYTNDHSQGIYAMRFDERSGALTATGLAATTASPSFLTASADGRFLFAVNEVSTYGGQASGSVTSFAINRSKGTLNPISVQSSHGTDPCHLALDRTGRFLAVANYTSGTIAVLPVSADGKLLPAVTVVALEGKGPNVERQAGPHAHQVIFSSDNRFLTAVDLGSDRVMVYRFDATKGTLTPNTPPSVSIAPGAGPRHVAFHPDGTRAFTIAELASTITSMTWDGATGTFTAGRSISTLPADFKGTSTTAEIAVHPNGRFVYGSNRGHDSLAVFSINPDASLKLVEFAPTRGQTPRHFAIAPGGQWLLAANQDSGTIAVFRIDQQTGALSPVGPLVTAGTPVCILFQ